jgi:hypothetical protein
MPWVGRHRPQLEPELGPLQQQPQQDALRHQHRDEADGVLADHDRVAPAREQLDVALRERRGHELGVGPEDELSHRVEAQEQAQSDDHDVERAAGLLDWANEHPLDHRARDEGDGHGDADGGHDRQAEAVAFGCQLPRDVGREQRHLALGEVEDPGGAEDDHEGEGHRPVDQTVADAVDDLFDEELHVVPRTPSEPQVGLADGLVVVKLAGITLHGDPPGL